MKTCPRFEMSFEKQNCLYYLNRGSNECGLCSRSEFYRCIRELDEKPIPLSHSTLQDFLTCHHYFYLAHIRGIEVQPSQMGDPLKEGSLWNSLLDYYLSNRATENPSNVVVKYEMSERSIAKVRALFRAYRDLEIKVDPGFELQKRIDIDLPVPLKWNYDTPYMSIPLHGYYDRKYPNYFVECKYSGKPDRYLDVFFLSSQIGTYFLADESLQYVIMEIVRNPDLRSTGQFKSETPEQYGNRVYEDAMIRSGHYFINIDRDRDVFGKKFVRSEFNIKEIESRYPHVLREIYEAIQFNGFYKNDRACTGILPGIPCPYLNLCRYDVMSEVVYRVKEKIERESEVII